MQVIKLYGMWTQMFSAKKSPSTYSQSSNENPMKQLITEQNNLKIQYNLEEKQTNWHMMKERYTDRH